MSGARLGVWPMLMMVGVACNGLPPEAQPPPPPGDTDEQPWEPPDDTPTFPLDTGFDGPQDATPERWLHVTHHGSFTLSGDPYDALQGVLEIVEIVSDSADHAAAFQGLDDLDPLDEDEQPACKVTYALTGVPPGEPTGCPCEHAFDVNFFVSEGSPAGCRLPDIPSGGELRRLGFSRPNGAIFVNYKGTGVYLPWYPASQTGDTVTFEWTTSVGVVVEDM